MTLPLDSAQGRDELRRADLGRVVAVGLFTSLLLLNAARLFSGEALREPLSTVTSVLTMAFYVLLVWAYLRRTPTSRTDRHWGAWLIALVATGAPFAFPLVSGGPRGDGAVATAAVVVLIGGLMAMLWALGALGTNISVVPQAREAVTHGPYARVRHPLYTAELLSGVGICLASTGPGPWLLLAALVVLQVMRARREEALLARELTGYDDYRNRTPMLVPSLRRT
jgi:protein-S-isoprenylcysteine O-methyltransferase Ste14